VVQEDGLKRVHLAQPGQRAREACVAGVYIDVTVYIDVLNQPGRNEADLRALRDHSGLACARLAWDAMVREASAATAELLLIRLSELVGQTAATVLAKDFAHDDLKLA
jgi:hypothetical protein